MRRVLALALALTAAAPASAAGLLVPTEKAYPPLAMLSHEVAVKIEDQVAVTRVEQVFRNHTERNLEATYIFPVPKGASVKKFSVWIDGKEVQGEMVEADKARKLYTEVISQTKDPALLEYMGSDLIKLKVSPVPSKGDRKVAISYTSVATADNGLIEYVYPLKTDGKAVATLQKFSVRVDLTSQHRLTNVYSPSHAISVTRPNDREAQVVFEKDAAALDRDFQLFYQAGGKDVGLTALTHRPAPSNPGHFMLLISPRAELSKEQQVPRDMVFVLDTSGSMRGKRIQQARNALKYCLSNLNPKDRFAVIHFATAVNKYDEKLLPASADNVTLAKKWADELEATGGTAINDALAAALAMRPNDPNRPFTVVFFTDGRPTIGETNTDKILKNVLAKNNANTRVFTFGVGDDVNAAMLDQIAEQSKALASYVRENEDIEAKVSSLYGKISNPVLTNLKLTVGDNVKISEVYPPELPDLFHGNQVVVLGRYTGDGHVAIKLSGQVGSDRRDFVYETNFSAKSGDDKTFVEDLWARRKVGYLLDQVRLNGERKELVEEIVSLAKRYGITTPYTSYLIVPDAPTKVAAAPRLPGAPDKAEDKHGKPNVGFDAPKPAPNLVPPALQPGAFAPVNPGFAPGPVAGKDKGGVGNFQGGFGGGPTASPPPGGFGGGGGQAPVTKLLDQVRKEGIDGARRDIETWRLTREAEAQAKGPKDEGGRSDNKKGGKGGDKKGDPKASESKPTGERPGGDDRGEGKFYNPFSEDPDVASKALKDLKALEKAKDLITKKRLEEVQNGELGVDIAVQNANLRYQNYLGRSAIKRIQNRNAIDVGGVYIDEAFTAKMETVAVKAMSKAYFRILEKRPEMRDVFALGNHVVWVTPSGKALIIDTTEGQTEMTDAVIDQLFTAPVKKK